jgi:hypothetical protein
VIGFCGLLPPACPTELAMDQVTILGVVRPVAEAAGSAGTPSIAITPAAIMLVVGRSDQASALQRIASTRSWATSRLAAAV